MWFAYEAKVERLGPMGGGEAAVFAGEALGTKIGALTAAASEATEDVSVNAGDLVKHPVSIIENYG